MKGKLEKTIKGQWVVRVISEETPECDTIIEHGKQFPVHPDYVKYYFLDEDAEGSEVEFEIINKLWGINDDIISYAKLIKPGMGSKVDLQKLEAKLDKILSEETPESFHKWLESKRGPIKNYHSTKIDEMLKEIEEDDIKDWAHLTSVSKGLDGSVYQSTYLEAFIDGYNKAKEILYTLKEMRMSYEAGQDYQGRFENNLPKGKSFGDFIQSLKQPKQ